MSVTTSAPNIEPPPLLFGQRSPTPPPFASPRLSPHHTQAVRSPLASQPSLGEDIDMSTSATLPPRGQDHDRQGWVDGGANHGDNNHAPPSSSESRTEAQETVVTANEDDMDITLDGLPDQAEVNALTQHAENRSSGTSAAAADGSQERPTEQGHNIVRVTSNGSSIDSSGDVPLPMVTMHDDDDSPPASRPRSPSHLHNDRGEDDSSEDEDHEPEWEELHEDTSAPRESELREIEVFGETSALDHAHWEKRTFTELSDPEYIAGPSGRIEWTINNFNGTREKPNKELVLRSPITNVGGYDWQIKFYPKGNDSDYLSIYVECVSMARSKTDRGEGYAASDETNTSMFDAQESEVDPNVTHPQHAPLPLLGVDPIPKRPSVAAQVSVVLYNPAEPRVNYCRTCLHRFCPDSPDWGWTRFHGPREHIHTRHRGQRQALLRNDTLAFTSYIRIVEDATGCLWEHDTKDNHWDSFAMTGLQGLVGSDSFGTPAGGIISAISSWMLLKPLRQLLYSIKPPDPEAEPRIRPKPLLVALQTVLYSMRTQVQPKRGPVTLEDISEALEWYGIDQNMSNIDVIEIWEILRTKLEAELQDTPYANRLVEIFGVRKDRMLRVPSYHASIKEAGSISSAVNASPQLLHPAQPLPEVLCVELERQEFHTKSRTWRKLVNKVTLDDEIKVRGVPYVLYGFVVHKENLQSGLYYPVLRPEGPGSKWYTYKDSKDGNRVLSLTRKQAIDAHEGCSTSETKVRESTPVAYIVMYVRGDIAEAAFSNQPEPWDVPKWIVDEVKTANDISNRSVGLDGNLERDGAEVQEKQDVGKVQGDAFEEMVGFEVVDSKVFLEHEGPGMIDMFDRGWSPSSSKHVYDINVPAKGTPKDIQQAIASAVDDVEDPRQCRFWVMDSRHGSDQLPTLMSTGSTELPAGTAEKGSDWTARELAERSPECRLWLHIVDRSELPELPPTQPLESMPAEHRVATWSRSPSPSDYPPPPGPNNDDDGDQAAPPAPPAPPMAEDVPMSDADEEGTGADQNAVEAAAAIAVTEAVPVEILTADPAASDAEMGGVLERLPPPPPSVPAVEAVAVGGRSMVFDLSLPPPPPPAVAASYDEMYIFLKLFDAEAQRLECCGSYLVKRTDRVDSTVLRILKLHKDTPIDLYEEEVSVTRKLERRHGTFSQEDIYTTAIVIAQRPIPASVADGLAGRGAFADAIAYLQYRRNRRNFPTQCSGHFTLDYFSSEHYSGTLHARLPHGQGKKIYFSGDTYEGSFRLGRRHGHGLMTFQNGDTYDGEWVEGQQHGVGTFVEAGSGNTYVGGWRNDRRFGEGVTHWKVAQETERLCRICWEEAAEAAFYDCGHVVACLGCARRVDNCPVCRKRVLSAMKLYYVS